MRLDPPLNSFIRPIRDRMRMNHRDDGAQRQQQQNHTTDQAQRPLMPGNPVLNRGDAERCDSAVKRVTEGRTQPGNKAMHTTLGQRALNAQHANRSNRQSEEKPEHNALDQNKICYGQNTGFLFPDTHRRTARHPLTVLSRLNAR